ncbi:hypothetical protein [Hasllibacter sp. MH4015]|uniref:hypothetical protein n=1 Tax=Hasllibacter sp. MH4015 TaxID=2854029 RepID=UPI001CD65952|nr:hypothetical protein [Hasllibacter sp. MH4015]
MKPVYILLGAGVIALAGCQSLFNRGETYDRGTVTVENTDYQIFERVRSTDATIDDPRNDPTATRAVYARVGTGATVYCGQTIAGCEAAIRRFNAGTQSSDEMY